MSSQWTYIIYWDYLFKKIREREREEEETNEKEKTLVNRTQSVGHI